MCIFSIKPQIPKSAKTRLEICGKGLGYNQFGVVVNIFGFDHQGITLIVVMVRLNCFWWLNPHV
jgi:hypothetical protein